MTPIEIYCIATQCLNAILSFLLGFYVLVKKPHSMVSRTAFAFTASVGLFSVFYILWISAAEPDEALFWIRMVMIGCVPIPAFFFHFITSLLAMNSREKPAILVFYLCSLLILPFVFTPLLVKNVTPKLGFSFWPNPGPVFFIYTIQYMVSFFYSHYLMSKVLKKESGNYRNQIKYVFIGTFPAFAGGATNFALWYNIPIPPVGNILISAYVATIAYAILQHQLMDINVVIRKSFVYSLLITLLTTGYFGLAYLMEQLLQGTFGYQNLWFSLGSFSLMALIFQPLKTSLQKTVDWLVFRAPQEQILHRMERLEEQALQAEKFKAVSTLAAGMAHEIKNPLTALRTFAEFLPEKHRDPEFAAQCHQIFMQETGRIQEIVWDVLTFAKPRAPKPEPVDLSRLIDSTVNLLSGHLIHRKIRWLIDCRHNGTSSYADPDQLRQVLINLIQNAADAMPNGGELKIATQAVNSHVELAVSDTGHGIPPALLPKIFDPFVTTKQDGNGLGLAMVYSILQAHHGSIRADSVPNRGTTFTVSLPL